MLGPPLFTASLGSIVFGANLQEFADQGMALLTLFKGLISGDLPDFSANLLLGVTEARIGRWRRELELSRKPPKVSIGALEPVPPCERIPFVLGSLALQNGGIFPQTVNSAWPPAFGGLRELI